PHLLPVPRGTGTSAIGRFGTLTPPVAARYRATQRPRPPDARPRPIPVVMVRVSSDPRMLDHATPVGHPESRERLAAVLRRLSKTSVRDACPSGVVREATDEELGRVHDLAYITSLARFEEIGGGRIEADTWL